MSSAPEFLGDFAVIGCNLTLGAKLLSISTMRIPETGLSKEQIAAALENARMNDLAWRKGRAFAYVYDGGKEIEEVGKLFFHPFGSNVPKPKLELSRDKLTSVPRQLLYRKGIPHVGIRASAR